MKKNLFFTIGSVLFAGGMLGTHLFVMDTALLQNITSFATGAGVGLILLGMVPSHIMCKLKSQKHKML